MNRHYTSEEYIEKVEILRKYFDNPAITTDIIVGFPGETDEDFKETLETVKKVGFYQIHVFKYSMRDGTVAAGMENQVDERVKNARSEVLINLADELQTKYEQQFINTEQEVLFEEEIELDNEKYMVGHSKNYLQIGVKTDENLKNTIKKVKLVDLHKNHIILATI